MSEAGAAAQYLKKMEDPNLGYDLNLRERFQLVLGPALERNVKLLGNFGAANPLGGARVVADVARQLTGRRVRVASVEGDDVIEYVLANRDLTIMGQHDQTIDSLEGTIIAANAYIGAEPMAEALAMDADVVVAGRVSDASLYLAPMLHEFGWSLDDWDRLGRGITVGHLLECGSVSTGGMWAEPGYREVPRMAQMGMPLAVVQSDGTADVSKTPDSGGVVNQFTLSAHLMHEINDPKRYLNPDVVADFTKVHIEDAGEDHASVFWNSAEGPAGTRRPDTLKVLVGIDEGYLVDVWLLCSGYKAVEKARMCEEIIRERLEHNDKVTPLDDRFDYIGLTSGLGDSAPMPETLPGEVMLRYAARVRTHAEALTIARLSEYLIIIGPLGMGERRQNIRKSIGIYPTLVPREVCRLNVEMVEVN